ncbi:MULTISPECIES: sugar phosphate isomerase/epimerase family protein [Stenotrophomonas]|uniref:Sugar phosphate isomerase/epimerase n=1 Tax=Stenotrophomonas maltophilia TaxID=40324 RepID=A0A2J0SPT7_STEMA|nr:MULTISPECIES: sugar phosphate isomerase/epimerase [Stenotrophomonas]MBA0313300.1 sugar phosphate isomerase/epimerase [Stenotrophomonas maltophilia]MBH1745150.1 sugar phosphate isomerase/epimerase [Stenotrophomonas maltophilia]MBH1865995.1 sugar phosphate isomerase/epimerase [Stenotrophomonas maltophilia]MDH1389639.1 sugar phosphate isomerase/epimerase [Stenotrophomonas sp. GD03701]MDH1394246.1 sugar phosphate isomerase/epimerase [Stenotrophomonas sp. GD03702]
MKTPVRRAAALALLLLTALPGLASEAVAAQKPIAVQMYSLRNAGSLDQQLKIVRDAGVHAVETVGTQGVSASELKQLLDRYSIRAISSHVALAELRRDLDGVVAFNRSIGNATLVVPYLDAKDRPTDAAGWTALGQELGRLSKQVRAKGMRLAYHNHDFELVDFNGRTGLELLFAAAGPDLQTELDLAWVARSGHDPAVMLGKFRDRLFAVHAKDNAPKGQAQDEGGFAAVGQGVLDWNAILPAAAAAGVHWYILEHDQPRDPAKVIQTGADYLREHLTVSPHASAQR